MMSSDSPTGKIIFSRKPMIGISTRFDLNNNYFYLNREYSEAVQTAGGIPYHFGLIPDIEYIREALAHLNGIILPGGSDIDPLRFNEEPRPGLGTVLPLRDETDLQILAEAEKLNLPVLGICYGMQILNVFRGGSIFQDIEREIPQALNHQQGAPRERLSHNIFIEQETILFDLAKETGALVNSHHHQSINQLGKNLKISARAADGVIEAIEDVRENRFNLGVQWHPEVNHRNDELSKSIFAEFVRRARNHRNSYR